MFKKVAVTLAVILLLAVVTLVVYANGDRSMQVNWKIAGPIMNDIQITDAEAPGDYSLLNLSAKGAPGNATIMAVGTGEKQDEVDEQCPGANVQVKFENGGFVAVFEDQSMLYFTIDESEEAQNALCITFGSDTVGAFEYNITGGAGRFDGATGHVLVTTTSWGITPVLSAEKGNIVGTIELP